MIKHQKRTISAEDEDIVIDITKSESVIDTEPTIDTNKDVILNIRQRNFWPEELSTDITDKTITIPLSEYVTRLYLSNNYYNKEKINEFIENFGVKIIVLDSTDELPEDGDDRYANSSYIFFVKHNHPNNPPDDDIYDEYIWDSDSEQYEKIGNTDIDLTSYMKTVTFENWRTNTYNVKIAAIEADLATKITLAQAQAEVTAHNNSNSAHNDIRNAMEVKSNKVNSLSSNSTTSQYPSAKCVFDELETKSDVGHNHNDLYYTETEMNTLLDGKADNSDIPTKTSDLVNDGEGSGKFLVQHQDISGKEDISNKVTSISSSSTDTQYPSAKCMYDELELKADLTYVNSEIANMISEENLQLTSYLLKEDLIHIIDEDTEIVDDGIYIVNDSNIDNVYEIDLESNKTIIQTGESAVITASLTKNNTAIDNANVLFDNTQFIKTDNNGEAEFTYTSQGRGAVKIPVSYNKILEEKILIEDYITYSKNASWNNIYCNNSGAVTPTITPGQQETEVSCVFNGNSCNYLYMNDTVLSGNFELSFNIKRVASQNNHSVYIGLFNKTNHMSNAKSAFLPNGFDLLNVIITYNNGQCTIKSKKSTDTEYEILSINSTGTLSSEMYFGVLLYANSVLTKGFKISNFKVYNL